MKMYTRSRLEILHPIIKNVIYLLMWHRKYSCDEKRQGKWTALIQAAALGNLVKNN